MTFFIVSFQNIDQTIRISNFPKKFADLFQMGEIKQNEKISHVTIIDLFF